MENFDFVVFDVGGVLVELTGGERMIEWTRDRYPSTVEMYHDWIMSPSVQKYEKGLCSITQFCSGVVSEFDLPVNEQVFLEEFLAWPNGLLPGISDILDNVKQRYGIACLSNTNSAHWYNQIDSDYLNAVFDKMFLSFQMGMVKPDREIYDEMVIQLDTRPDRILFLDDNQVNVQGAAEAGITAELANGVDQVRNVLKRHACID